MVTLHGSSRTAASHQRSAILILAPVRCPGQSAAQGRYWILHSLCIRVDGHLGATGVLGPLSPRFLHPTSSRGSLVASTISHPSPLGLPLGCVLSLQGVLEPSQHRPFRQISPGAGHHSQLLAYRRPVSTEVHGPVRVAAVQEHCTWCLLCDVHQHGLQAGDTACRSPPLVRPLPSRPGGSLWMDPFQAQLPSRFRLSGSEVRGHQRLVMSEDVQSMGTVLADVQATTTITRNAQGACMAIPQQDFSDRSRFLATIPGF